VVVGLLLIVAGVAAGLFGSLLGLGGGVLIVPLLTIGFGVDVREAVGVSLVCVIVTSGAAASVYLERHVANLRLGMLLELFTASGAIIGGLIAFLLDERVLAGLFAALLAYVAVTMLRRAERATAAGPVDDEGGIPDEMGDGDEADAPSDDASAGPLGSPSADPVPPGSVPERGFVERLSGPGYTVHRFPAGVVGSVFAGVISALLGIGGGIVKVPVMHLIMGTPLRVATATSNLMIGITASTSAIIYLVRGGIDPYAAGPTAIGVFIGATIGSRAAHRIDLRFLRLLFVVVLLYTAYEMARRALGIA
jgi:uncharacterized membrane protein YfcA